MTLVDISIPHNSNVSNKHQEKLENIKISKLKSAVCGNAEVVPLVVGATGAAGRTFLPEAYIHIQAKGMVVFWPTTVRTTVFILD